MVVLFERAPRDSGRFRPAWQAGGPILPGRGDAALGRWGKDLLARSSGRKCLVVVAAAHRMAGVHAVAMGGDRKTAILCMIAANNGLDSSA